MLGTPFGPRRVHELAVAKDSKRTDELACWEARSVPLRPTLIHKVMLRPCRPIDLAGAIATLHLRTRRARGPIDRADALVALDAT